MCLTNNSCIYLLLPFKALYNFIVVVVVQFWSGFVPIDNKGGWIYPISDMITFFGTLINQGQGILFLQTNFFDLIFYLLLPGLP